MEDDNGGAFDAVNEAPEEVRHVGHARAEYGPEHASQVQDEQVRDVPGPEQRNRELAVAAESVYRVGSAQEGTVAESGRFEPPSGSVHQEVQRRDEAAAAGVVESVPGDD